MVWVVSKVFGSGGDIVVVMVVLVMVVGYCATCLFTRLDIA